MILIVMKEKFYIQAQINDFLGRFLLHIKRMRSISKKVSKALRRLENIRQAIKAGVQKLIEHFYPKERPHRYVPRLKTPHCMPYKGDKLTAVEKTAYQNIPSYMGSLRHLFLFYPWEHLDRFEKEGVEFSLVSRIKAQMIMCKKQIFTYSRLIEELEEKPGLLEVCGLHAVPDRKVISRTVDVYGVEPFRFLFHDLARICMSYGIMRGRFMGFDGTLLKSNCSPFKRNGSYTDPGAGLYIRGRYIKGVGRLVIEGVDLEYEQPMLIKTYYGSSSENPLFRQVLDDFRSIYGFYPKMVDQDRGSDSEANREFCRANNIEGFLQARDFGKGDVVYTPRGKCYRKEMLQEYSLDLLEKVADMRSGSERSISRDMWGYSRRWMSNRGDAEAESYVLVTGSTTLSTSLTAYNVGRPDLIRSPTAFSRLWPQTNF